MDENDKAQDGENEKILKRNRIVKLVKISNQVI